MFGWLIIGPHFHFLKHNNTYFLKKDHSRGKMDCLQRWNEKILSKTKSITVNHFKSWFASGAAVVYLTELERHFVWRTSAKMSRRIKKKYCSEWSRLKAGCRHLSRQCQTSLHVVDPADIDAFWKWWLTHLAYSSKLPLRSLAKVPPPR